MFGEEWLVQLDGIENVEAQWKYLLSKLRGAELECVPSKMIDKYAAAHKHRRTNIDKLTAEEARKNSSDVAEISGNERSGHIQGVYKAAE